MSEEAARAVRVVGGLATALERVVAVFAALGLLAIYRMARRPGRPLAARPRVRDEP